MNPPIHLPAPAGVEPPSTHREPTLSRRTMVIGAGLAATAMAAGGLAAPESARAAAGVPTGLVGRGPMPRLTMTSGGMIQRGGRNFRAGGINAFQLITNDYPSPRLMRHAQIDALFAKALALDVGVIRAHTLAASVGNPWTLVTGVSGSGASPTIAYNQVVWDTMDYAVWRAGQLGLYLIAPFVDELGYYHGGKRHWVNFRRPGSVSMDVDVKAANSARQRAAEDAFYTDQQIGWDFQQYVRDWLTHVNPRTGLAYKDEPALSIVQIGNELWTAAQDAPGWVADTAALIKGISPTTLVMDSGADGLRVEAMAWDSPHVDILETHPYTTFGAGDVARMATFAASKGKAFAVGEYPWSKADAPAIERVVRRTGNIFTSALWSLQNGRDLHNQGAAYGTDDVSFRMPGRDAVQRSAVVRVRRHHRRLAQRAPRSRPPAIPKQGAEDFTGAAGAAWSSDRWTTHLAAGVGAAATVVGNRGRLHLPAVGGYDGSSYVIPVSLAPASTDQSVAFTLYPQDVTREAYFRVPLRAQSIGDDLARRTCYFVQIGAERSGAAYISPGKVVDGVETFFRGGITIPGWADDAPVAIGWSVVGSTLRLTLNGAEVWSGTDGAIPQAGYTGFELRGGAAAVAVDWDVDAWRLA